MFTKIDEINRFANIIFINFIDLQYESGISFTIDSIKDNLKSPGLLGWFLIDNNDKVVGYIVGEKKNLEDGRYVYYLSYFYIIPKYRSKGIGKTMLQNTLNHINKINIPFILLTSQVNTNAFKLYRDLGFVFDSVIKINNPKFTALLHFSNQGLNYSS